MFGYHRPIKIRTAKLDGLELDKIFTDKVSGKATDRPALK
jgi:hypothetical protein